MTFRGSRLAAAGVGAGASANGPCMMLNMINAYADIGLTIVTMHLFLHDMSMIDAYSTYANWVCKYHHASALLRQEQPKQVARLLKQGLMNKSL